LKAKVQKLLFLSRLADEINWFDTHSTSPAHRRFNDDAFAGMEIQLR